MGKNNYHGFKLSAMNFNHNLIWPARVSDNKRFLVHADGSPFFFLADTAWQLFHNIPFDEADFYLRARAAQGFTVVQAVALAEYGGLSTPNRNGDFALIDLDPTKPNEAYFAHMDRVIERAGELGLTTALLPTWGDKWNKKWGEGPEIFTPENAAIYGEWLGHRYKDAPIIWVVGGDRPVESDGQRAIIEAMATGLARGDEARHLITFHPNGSASSSHYFPDAPWLDFHMWQTGHARGRDNGALVARDYALSPVKPCTDGEPGYEDHPSDFDPKNGFLHEFDVRGFAYRALFAGAHGHTYGCHDIWQFFTGENGINWPQTEWKKALDLHGAWQMGHAKNLLLSRPFFERVPDSKLVLKGERVAATRAQSGSYALLYLPDGAPVEVNTDLLSGQQLRVWWFDPRTGNAGHIGTSPRTASMTFTPPTHEDWVLVLDDSAQNFAAPGQPRPKQ